MTAAEALRSVKNFLITRLPACAAIVAIVLRGLDTLLLAFLIAVTIAWLIAGRVSV
jgi:hypothetical protein